MRREREAVLTATADELRELFSMDPDDPLDDRIDVCAGVWVREGYVWVCYDEP